MMQIAYTFIDVGNGFYPLAVRRFVESARREMPGAQIVQLSDKDTPIFPEADAILRASVAPKGVTDLKGRLIAALGRQAQQPVVFCDVDLVWHSSCAEVFEREFDVAVMWRPTMVSQPYNAGLIFSKPTEGARWFWQAYDRVLSEMEQAVGHWYDDQLALAVLIGQSRPGNVVKAAGAKVLILDMDEIAPAPETKPEGKGSGYAWHFKGNRKEWLDEYAENLRGRGPEAADQPVGPDALDHPPGVGSDLHHAPGSQDAPDHP